MELHGPLEHLYLSFAEHAAAESPCLADWARRVAGDRQVGEWLDTLPGIKRQPNLVFAAARWHGVPAPGPYDALREALLGDDGSLRATILTRSTQTNEAGRLATLVPSFAALPGPLALLEVGASAGLCLYPDRWDYRWTGPSGHELIGSGGPLLTCAAAGPVPYPSRHPEIAWRAGIDLHPLDVEDPDATDWLEILIWPEQDHRRARLREAVEIARADPPDIMAGDLFDALPGRLAEASRHATPVVFHSAVIAYLDVEQRQRFVELMCGLVADGACHWISNEGQRVLPSITATGPVVPDDEVTFVLGVDGQAVAWTHGHGSTLMWL